MLAEGRIGTFDVQEKIVAGDVDGFTAVNVLDACKISLRRSPLGWRADDMGSPGPELIGEVPAAAGPAQLP